MTGSIRFGLTVALALCVLWPQALLLAQTPPPVPSGNVYLAGGTVRPSGPVQGDIVAVGGRVIVDQPVSGDALLMGGSVDARADIGDDLRAAGGDLSIEASVGGELMAAGGNLSLTSAAVARRGASLAGGVVTIDGRVEGPLKVTAQRVVINGSVQGDARLYAERIELGPTSRISGTLHHASRELRRAEGAVIGGAVTSEVRRADADDRDERDRERREDRRWDHRWQSSGPSWAGMALGFLGLLAAGVVYLLLFPRFAVESPEALRRSPWLALAVGFGTLVGVPVLAVLLMITVLGIPLGIAAMALYPLLLLVGYLCGALFVATRARLGLHKEGGGFGISVAFLALALLILMLLGSLPLIGPLTVFLTTIAGLGACVLDVQRRRQAPAAPGP